jgi:amino acid adenylation domain-containing protein
MSGAADSRSLRSDFLANAAARPDAPALVVSGTSVSYGELARRARTLASAVTDGGRRPAERVAVFASRSQVAYAGTLAALCSGAAFVPLSHKFPVDRTRNMLRRAAVDAVIVDKASAASLPTVLQGLDDRPRVIAPEPGVADALRAKGIAAVGADELAALEPLAELPPVVPDDIAYLLFTSGTTGEPKGVAVTHANVLHYLDVMQRRYGLAPDDRCSQTFDQTFDLAVHDLFMAWGAGASVYAMQPIEQLAPVRFVQKHGLTVWFSVPSAAALALKKSMLQPGVMPSLRYSLFCGEPLPVTTAGEWQTAAPNSVVENLYGPTELTIACFVYRWDAERSPDEAVNGIVPIGRPLPDLGALVVGEDLRPAPAGEVGELLVSGAQTTPGYWRDAVKTQERFVRLDGSRGRRERFYRTGDRVRQLPSGDYVYIGRVDNQIKVLGFRVELGEVEAVLLRDGGAVQAAAVGWPMEDGRALGIVAFVSGSATPPEAMVRLAAAKLPAYMVPSRVVTVDEMPLNANGKIDRHRLVESLDGALVG